MLKLSEAQGKRNLVPAPRNFEHYLFDRGERDTDSY